MDGTPAVTGSVSAGKERRALASCHEPRRRMMDIRERMEVVDANDQHVGIVQSVEGDRINLIKNDALDPRHPFIDKSQIATVENNKVKLSQKVSAIATRAFVSADRPERSAGRKF
jgi:hypothetical protein